MSPQVNIGRVKVDNLTKDEALIKIELLVKLKNPCYINCINADVVVRYNRDDEFARFYNEGKLCITDGTLILWAANFLHTPIKQKIAGSDLVIAICELAYRKRFKVFFLGGRPGSAILAKQRLQEQLNAGVLIDTYCPPYDFEKYTHELQKIDKIVRSAKPDILFVGLGSPKREKWIKECHQRLDVPVTMGVGAAFEWIGGMLKRAPFWMQNMGLEWFWRLLLEPRRLWKRYLIDDFPFFLLILEQRMKQEGLAALSK